ncbi:uncharacterized protein LOC143203405 [Rhynchophorus ferrugineus]|uniref:uncharacterized protein LOC143203405 n=1 Tax=Rhynchophorus ferrugineus TaxID=354439 RepID=UPI003FCC586F
MERISKYEESKVLLFVNPKLTDTRTVAQGLSYFPDIVAVHTIFICSQTVTEMGETGRVSHEIKYSVAFSSVINEEGRRGANGDITSRPSQIRSGVFRNVTSSAQRQDLTRLELA